MEDFLKFLLIAGVILVGIFKELNKNSKAKKAKAKHPVPPMPSPVEVNPDTAPMPEAWGRPKSLEELFQPILREQPVAKQPSKQQTSKQKKKKEVSSDCRSVFPLKYFSPDNGSACFFCRMNRKVFFIVGWIVRSIIVSTLPTVLFILCDTVREGCSHGYFFF